MSFQKKSLILQQLEQAIRKKAQEKSKNKQQLGRVLQGSVERKKQALKTATKPEARLSSALRQSQNSQKPPPDKAISIFGQEPTFEGSQLRAKKYNNRRLDKLLSLVQYLMSSSEKALRFISPSNFEAEFALKLYRSDRENLLNELKNLTVEDIIDSQRQVQKSRPEEVNQLAEENAKLKKEILLLEKQAQNYLKSKGQSLQVKGSTRQNTKMKQILRKVIPFDSFKQLTQLLDKQAKFELMAAKSQENSKKTTEIEIVLSSLENQRSLIVDNLAKLREASKTDRSGRLTQIQGEKEQLQKEVGMMKSKLADMMEANKALAQLELLKKNSEVMHERFLILARELQLSTKKGSQQLFEQIRSALQLQQQNQYVLTQKTEQAGKELDFLRSRLKVVEEERAQLEKELRSSEEQARVESMLRQMQKFKQVIDELGEQQQLSSQRIVSLQQELNVKQSQIDQLKGLVEAREEQIDSNEQARQVLLNKLSERQQREQSLRQKMLDETKLRGQLQEKFNKANKERQLLQSQLANLQDKSIKESQESQSQVMAEFSSLKMQLQEKEQSFKRLLEQSERMQQKIREDTNLLKNKALQINRLREEIKHISNIGKQDEQLRAQIEALTQERDEYKEKFLDLTEDYQIAKKELEKLKDSMNNFNELQAQFSIQKEELKMTKEQLEASHKDIDNISKRSQQSLSRVTEELVTVKTEVALIEKAKSELEGVKAVLQQRLGVSEEEIECLQRKNQSLEAEVNELKQEIRSLTLVSNEVHNSMEQSREVLSSLQDQKLELARQLVTAKQQLEDSSELARFRSRQYVSLLRQILKGLQIDPSEYEDKQTFEELLELGSQQVLQLRKKQRDQQSIKRKHGRREQESPTEEGELKEVSVKLFNHQDIQDKVALQDAKTVQQKSSNILEYQNQVESKNTIFIAQTEKSSADNQKNFQANKAKEKQQKEDELNEDQNFSIALPEKLSLNSVYHPRKPNNMQTLDEFEQLGNSRLGESLVSQQSNHKSLEEASYKNQESFDMNDKISEHSNKSRKKQEEQPQQGNLEEQIYMQNDSMLYSIQLNLQSSITKSDKQERDPKFHPYSKHTMQSVALKKEKLDLDNFEEAKSVNNSFASIRDVQEDHQGPPEDYVELPHVDLQATIKPKLDEDDGEGKGIEQFGELQQNLLSQSMLSQVQSEGQVDIDEFGQLKDNLGASMVSQSIDESEKSKEQEINLDQFGDLKENLGASMISQQSEEAISKSKEELGLDQFGELQEHLNNSMHSQTQSEHGLSQFGDLQDGNLGQSMVSEGQGLSEFGEVEQDLNESLISQKEEKD